MSTSRKILTIDDDDDLRESLVDQLKLHDEFDIIEACLGNRWCKPGQI